MSRKNKLTSCSVWMVNLMLSLNLLTCKKKSPNQVKKITLKWTCHQNCLNHHTGVCLHGLKKLRILRINQECVSPLMLFEVLCKQHHYNWNYTQKNLKFRSTFNEVLLSSVKWDSNLSIIKYNWQLHPYLLKKMLK